MPIIILERVFPPASYRHESVAGLSGISDFCSGERELEGSVNRWLGGGSRFRISAADLRPDNQEGEVIVDLA